MSEQRVAHLDALRGIAACIVMAQHLARDIWEALPAQDWIKAVSLDGFDWGRFAVILFFLISGYVIPGSFKTATPVRRFLLTRTFRLYPAFWLSVLVAAALLWLQGAAPAAATVWANLTMAYPLFGEPALLGVYWTLVVELNFYLLALALFTLGRLDDARVIAALAILAIASLALPALLNEFGFSLPETLRFYHLAFLLLGTLVRLSHQGNRLAPRLAGLVSAALVATLPFLTGLIGGFPTGYSPATPMGATLAVLAALTVFFVSFRRAFAAPPRFLLALGAWSYAIYLFHEVVADAVRPLVPVEDPSGALVYAVAVIVLAVALSALVHRFIEKPAITLGKHLSARQSAAIASV